MKPECRLSRSRSILRSDGVRPYMRRAAVFNIDCIRSSCDVCRPASMLWQ